MEGTECNYPDCQIKDFLPFTCDLCGHVYCLDHRSRYAHNCHSQTASPSYSKKRSQRTEGESVKALFDGVERRFDSDTSGSNRLHYNIRTTHVDRDSQSDNTRDKIDRLDRVSDSQSGKQKSIADKTKQILFKNRATGNDSIAPEDRFFFEAAFAVSAKNKYVFFSKHTTLGEALHYIAQAYPQLAFGTAVRPGDMGLECHVASRRDIDWIDRNLPLPQCLDEFSCVNLSPISTSKISEAQSAIQVRDAERSEKVDSDTVDISTTVSPSPPEFSVGDRIVHVSSSGVYTEGVVVAVHRDDVELYYTVRLDGARERQTDASHLRHLSSVANEITSTPTDSVDTFPLRVSYKGKNYSLKTVPTTATVLALKSLIAKELRIGSTKLKLIYKGKVLKNNDVCLRGSELNILDNGVVMVIGQ